MHLNKEIPSKGRGKTHNGTPQDTARHRRQSFLRFSRLTGPMLRIIGAGRAGRAGSRESGGGGGGGCWAECVSSGWLKYPGGDEEKCPGWLCLAPVSLLFRPRVLCHRNHRRAASACATLIRGSLRG